MSDKIDVCGLSFIHCFDIYSYMTGRTSVHFGSCVADLQVLQHLQNFRIHLLALYFKLIVLLPPPLYLNSFTGLQLKKSVSFELATLTYKPSASGSSAAFLTYAVRSYHTLRS